MYLRKYLRMTGLIDLFIPLESFFVVVIRVSIHCFNQRKFRNDIRAPRVKLNAKRNFPNNNNILVTNNAINRLIVTNRFSTFPIFQFPKGFLSSIILVTLIKFSSYAK